MMTTNDPNQPRNDYYDTPEGHDQLLEFMRNSTGNGAVGAAAGGELHPGRAIGGATFSAPGGEASQGDSVGHLPVWTSDGNQTIRLRKSKVVFIPEKVVFIPLGQKNQNLRYQRGKLC